MDNALFKKLNFKLPSDLVVLHAPDTFRPQLDDMRQHTHVAESLDNIEQVTFALAFVTTLADVEAVVANVGPRLRGDATLWLAYPKGSSKRYKCEFNRDTGWAALGRLNMEPVRQVAVDEDWSALRFRNIAYIKTMTRQTFWAVTAENRDQVAKP